MTVTAEAVTSGSNAARPSTLSSPITNDVLLGSTEPRLYTPPLVEGPPGPCGCGCALTADTTLGFAVEQFAAELLCMPLDPWERFAVIHGLELLPDGRPRFRKLLIIVARQNGKTFLLMVLALYWLFVARVALVLGTSTNLDYARESWAAAVEVAEGVEELAELLPKNAVRNANGEQQLTVHHGRSVRGRARTVHKSRYKIAASNPKGGRSLTVHRLILDELREHHTWKAWNAAYNAMNAVRDAQAWAITNQGDARAVVLESLRNEAIDPETDEVRPLAERDPRLGVFEWSAPRGSRADDPYALAAANPNMNRHPDRGPFLEDLLSDARRAMRSGGEELTEFLTEILCMRVASLDPAVDVEQWRRPAAEGGCLLPGSLESLRSRVVWVFDVAPDGRHATLYAAAVLDDGRVRVDPVAAWDSITELRRELPALVKRNRPRAVGWFQNGPAAAVGAALAKKPGWPPAGVTFAALSADAPAVCMGFAELVDAGDVVQSGDPLADTQIEHAERKWMVGDRWVFTRRGSGHADAVYAVAGAAHLARTLPVPVGKPRLLVAKDPAD